ncbi:MAG: aldo/keto reductase [Roseiflexaceae bacterium]
MPYNAHGDRYASMRYNRSGKSGLKLPAISLGLWHNFGGVDRYETSRAMVLSAFDMGITHFDLANNYGPPAGSAEETFGQIMQHDLKPYRDEIIVSSKAGYYMWPGPYGEWGSRKYLVSSCDQSLKRMGLDYVDIFYHHRPDPDTPLEETMQALDYIVRSGRALYVGISNYRPERAKEAFAILKQLGTPCVIHQPSYNMFDRWIEDTGLIDLLGDEGVGCIPFSPLAQGMLTDRYLGGSIPDGSRASKPHGFLKPAGVTEEKLAKVRKLQAMAHERGQNTAQLALSWVLRDARITSALIGASSVDQIKEAVGALAAPALTAEDSARIETILRG